MALSTRQKAGIGGIFGAILIIGSISVIGFGALGTQIPQVVIEEETTPTEEPQEPVPPRKIDGDFNYDMVFVYADGTKERYSANVQVPDLALSLAPLMSIFSDQTRTKELKEIEISAQPFLDFPSDLTGIDEDVETESIVKVFLNDTLIHTETFSEDYRINQLESLIDPPMLYEFTLPVANNEAIQNLKDGNYLIRFESTDRILFDVEGEPRMIEVSGSPSVQMQGLEPFYVVNTVSSVSYKYDKVPQLYCTPVLESTDPIKWKDHCETISHDHYIRVTAKGFKPNANVNFDYTQTYAYHSSYRIGTDKTVKSDALGTAKDESKIGDGYSSIPCYRYYGTVLVSDGVNQATAIIGCKK